MLRLLNDGWSFCKLPYGSEIKDARLADMRAADIPHDWLIEQADNLYETSDGWYRRVICAPADDGKYRVLRFDGVYMDCEVFVNGSLACEHKYGYTAFDCALQPYLHNGDNEILVRVRHREPNSRWYSGAGVFRDVMLYTFDARHIATDGVYAHTERNGEDYSLTLRTEIKDEKPQREPITLKHELFDAEGGLVADADAEITDAGEHEIALTVNKPSLWSVDEPYLYTLRTTLGEQIVTQRLGFRDIQMTTDRGLFLNGKLLKLHGICNHHDLGALGAAFNIYAARRQLEVMRDMGVNALRTSHNPPAKRLMELCDEMGFLVIDEAFDMWERSKTDYDYARFFWQCSAEDVRSWIRRDRNHACLLMWSIGNEIYDTHADAERGKEITRYLMDEVKKNDPMLNAPVTIGSNYMAWENAQGCAELYKLAGYNYGERCYGEHHAKHPDWTIYGSETMSILTSRAVYHFPKSANILCEDDLQCSALGNSTTSWGARSFESALAEDMTCEYSLGQFIWSGIDYIGEPTPYKTRSCYFGQTDTACFPKDQYYLFRSYWRDAKDAPTLHIGVYWDFNDGQLIDIPVYTNLSKVELFLNGRSLGAQEINLKDASHAYGLWRAPYERGELRAVGYNDAGEAVMEDVRLSFGDAVGLTARVENHGIILADGEAMAFVVISAVDTDGRPVMNANNRVRVTVSGEGRLVGMDNGDSDDADGYKTNSRRMFGGMLLAMVGTTKRAGEIVIDVSSVGLRGATLRLETIEAEAREGSCACVYRCPKAPQNDEIPVRRLSLRVNGSTRLAANDRCREIRAEILPANATYRDIKWRAATDTGIDSNCAALEPCGNGVKLSALGDGTIYIRATCDNGAEHPRIISMLELGASGLGKPHMNPYEPISAGLFDISFGSVTAGNEHGVATARDGWCMFGFTNLDFGRIGSDKITIPIFALNDDLYEIEIWRGDPRDSDSELLGVYGYQKRSIWNTYQEEKYTLPRRLIGINTLCFVLTEKLHFKGFVFAKPLKAYSRLNANDCDRLYGDCFRRTERGVEDIGNNVVLTFDDMNFGEGGSVALRLHGSTPMQSCTVNIRINGADGTETTQTAEFMGVGESEQSFDVDVPKGESSVSFVFLPGSRFDFYDFGFGEKGERIEGCMKE